MSQFVVERAFLSDIGRKRDHNEDYVGFFEPSDPEDFEESGSLYIVADGVGGGAAGEVASEYAVRKVLHEYYRSVEPDLGQRLHAAIAAAHADLYGHVEEHPELGRMGTTIVAAVIRGDDLVICSVGDSRAYMIRDGEIGQLTRDHSLVAKLVEEGSIRADEAENHPRRNVLLRSLGVDSSVDPDIVDGKIQPGDRILLCSDGLTRHVADGEILEVAIRTSVDRAVKQLVDLANVRGGKDNISVFLLHAAGAFPQAPARQSKLRVEPLKPEIDDIRAQAGRRRTGSQSSPSRRRLIFRDLVLLLSVGDVVIWSVLLWIASQKLDLGFGGTWFALGAGLVILCSVCLLLARIRQLGRVITRVDRK